MTTFDEFRQLLTDDRSIRRFDQKKNISRETLSNLVELTRYCASGRNMQPLRYRIISSPEDCELVFPHLAWAGYLPKWDGPCEGERPAAYLIQCLDTRYGPNCLCDDGLQLQAITLGARSLGIGSCIIKAFNALKIKAALNLPEGTEPRYVLALGYPTESVVIEDMSGNPDADVKYYRTADGTHHVPKRLLTELMI